MLASLEERFDLIYDIGDLGRLKLGKHGQRDDLFSKLLGDGEVSLFITQMLVGAVQVEGNGVMDTCADSIGVEMGEKFVPAAGSKHIEMEDVGALYRNFWED